jgi:hypothetical protein
MRIKNPTQTQGELKYIDILTERKMGLCVRSRVRALAHTHTHTHTYIHIHTHTHTHTVDHLNRNFRAQEEL